MRALPLPIINNDENFGEWPGIMYGPYWLYTAYCEEQD